MHPRTQLIRIQRGMFRRLRKSARQFLGSFSPSMKKYFLEYLREFHDFKEVSNKKELLHAIQGAHIVLCGDYHTLSQAQRTVIRLLRDAYPKLLGDGRKLHLMLEMLRAEDKVHTDRFSASQISEAEFLKLISFHRNWGFSWENYKQLFRFAHDRAIGVHGINLGKKRIAPTLKQRDLYAAKVLCDFTAREPSALLFVLVGDLHLASNHLPKALQMQFEKQQLKRNVLIIHQNNERFYWKLVELGLEQLVDVVKIKDGVFCVMNTPPWVKLQSHLKWAELTAESDGPILASAAARNVEELSLEAFDTVDHTDEVRELVAVIANFVGLSDVKIDDFQIHGPNDLSSLERLREKGVSPSELKWHARCLSEFPSHFIPEGNTIFLKSLSLNQAAAQAARYLHAKASGSKSRFTDPARDFYPTVWEEALGFLGSKIINHKRKCSGLWDLKAVIQSKKISHDNGEAAELAVQHLLEENRYLQSEDKVFSEVFFPNRITFDRLVVYYKVAKLLGHLLGEGLYQLVWNDGLSQKEMKQLFRNPFSEPNSSKELYLEMIERVDKRGYRNIRKQESL